MTSFVYAIKMDAENNRDHKKKFKKKRKRTVISSQEISILEESYKIQPKPDRLAKLKLAKELEKTENFISIWFQNRRARERRERRLSAWDTSDRNVTEHQTQRVSSNDNFAEIGFAEEQPLDLTNKTADRFTVRENEPKDMPVVRSPLFSRLIRMAAAAEGGIISTDCPYADQAITDACSGIILQDGRLFYDPTNGFEIEEFK